MMAVVCLSVLMSLMPLNELCYRACFDDIFDVKRKGSDVALRMAVHVWLLSALRPICRMNVTCWRV